MLHHRAEVRAAEAGHRRRVHERERGPPVPGHERRVMRSRVVRDPDTGDRPGQRGKGAPGRRRHPGVGDLLPGRDGDHRYVRGLRAAVAVLADDLVVDLERLPRHGEVVGHPVGSAADGHHADGRHDDPEQGHECFVAKDEAGERWHRDLRVREPAAVPPAAGQACRRSPPPVVRRGMALGRTATGLTALRVLPGE